VRHLIPITSLPQIKEELTAGRLTITTDGSYDPITTRASYSWILEGTCKIVEASSPITSVNRNAYRAELMGILAALVTIKWVEVEHPGEAGSAVLYSDCQQAIRKSLKVGPIGIKDATQDEYDLILAIHHVNDSIKSEIKPLWTPGHPSPADPRGEQIRNAQAHALAVKRLHQPLATPYDDAYIECPIVTVSHRSTPITKGLPQQVIADIHYDPLRKKILKDTGWTEQEMDLVDWNGQHHALLKLPRPRQIAVSKLVNGLWNVNAQNFRYYQQPAHCPYCTATETIQHLFQCPSNEAATTHQVSLDHLSTALQAAKTPTAVSSTLIDGLTSWIGPSSTPPHSSQDTISKAFSEQTQIGWEYILKGRISNQ
jgi:ribonuclease HI